MEHEAMELGELAETANIAETLAREMKAPIALTVATPHRRAIALPPGWVVEESDDEHLQDHPRRKVAKVALDDAESLIAYVLRHKSSATTLWCLADYPKGKVEFTAILNDHGKAGEAPEWRDHTAAYTPVFSEEWNRWFGKNRQPMSQVDFATFLEDNLRDINGAEGFPTGTEMLEMALAFEANQDMRFKSAVRLQNGGVSLNFVQDDDAQTIAKMQMFDRFRIGIPVFWNGAAYAIESRLRYRVRDGKLVFWFELIRPDKTLEDAARTVIEQIRDAVEAPIYFGRPNR